MLLIERLLAKYGLNGIRIELSHTDSNSYINIMAVSTKSNRWQKRYTFIFEGRGPDFMNLCRSYKDKLYNELVKMRILEKANNGVIDTTSRWWQLHHSRCTDTVLSLVENELLGISSSEIDIYIKDCYEMLYEIDAHQALFMKRGSTRESITIELDLEGF